MRLPQLPAEMREVKASAWLEGNRIDSTKTIVEESIAMPSFASVLTPNMVYMVPFESEAHREKAWAAFRNDLDRAKLRDESIRNGGEIVRNISKVIMTPAGFSMIR